MSTSYPIEILHLFISEAHNFKGHEPGQPGSQSTTDADRVHCLAGRGIEGDRYLDFEPNSRRQISFLDLDVLEALRKFTGHPNLSAVSLRRNVVTEGVDLNRLIGKEFSIGDARFLGVEECRPCFWMNDICGPGAEAWLKGRGGLRAHILTDAWLARGPASLQIVD